MKKLKFRQQNGPFPKSANIINFAGLASIGLLLLSGFVIIQPSFQPTDASALECTAENSAQCMATSNLAGSALDVVIRPAISVGAQASVKMDITPDLTSDQFKSETAQLSVSTNSNAGYSVYMWTIDGSTELRNANASETAVIASITNQVSANDFSTNSWGYRVAPIDTLYSPVPTSSDTSIITSDAASRNDATDNYNIEFGVNIDKTLPTGQYYNSVVFSAVANPISVSSLYDLTYMQDITSEICKNSALHASKQLIDTRDGKSYWVAKLKDGHCWMTQNLALDLNTSRGLTPADTHLSTGYVPGANTLTTPPASGTLSTSTLSSQASWNFGKLVLAVPAYGTSCGDNISNLIGQCGKVSLVDVSDNTKFTPSYTAAEHQSWTLTDGKTVDDTLVSVNCTEWDGHTCIAGTYDAHYLIGNYYAWGAATAKNTSSAVDTDICPKGWKLPIQFSNVFADGSFANMLKQYGFVKTAAQNNSTGNVTRATVDGQEYYAFGDPVHYVESGYIHYQRGLNQIGSAMAIFPANAGVTVIVSPTTIMPSLIVNYNDGIVAESIRCISI